MTNVQLRAELFREINPLLDDEDPLKRVKDLKIPAKLRNKRGCIKLTEEDMKDEHIQYILNR